MISLYSSFRILLFFLLWGGGGGVRVYGSLRLIGCVLLLRRAYRVPCWEFPDARGPCTKIPDVDTWALDRFRYNGTLGTKACLLYEYMILTLGYSSDSQDCFLPQRLRHFQNELAHEP